MAGTKNLIAFAQADTILATAGMTRPGIMGRGRQAEPFQVPEAAKLAADAVAGLENGLVAVVGTVPASDKAAVSQIRALAVKLNREYSEVHFGAQRTDDELVTLYAIAGPLVVKTRKPKQSKATV